MSTRYTDRDGRVWGESEFTKDLLFHAGKGLPYTLRRTAVEYLVGPLTPVEPPKSADWQAGFAAGVAHQLRHGTPVESWKAMRRLPKEAWVLDADGEQWDTTLPTPDAFQQFGPWRLIYQPEVTHVR